jgi:hypothetical protein
VASLSPPRFTVKSGSVIKNHHLCRKNRPIMANSLVTISGCNSTAETSPDAAGHSLFQRNPGWQTFQAGRGRLLPSASVGDHRKILPCSDLNRCLAGGRADRWPFLSRPCCHLRLLPARLHPDISRSVAGQTNWVCRAGSVDHSARFSSFCSKINQGRYTHTSRYQ